MGMLLRTFLMKKLQMRQMTRSGPLTGYPSKGFSLSGDVQQTAGIFHLKLESEGLERIRGQYRTQSQHGEERREGPAGWRWQRKQCLPLIPALGRQEDL